MCTKHLNQTKEGDGMSIIVDELKETIWYRNVDVIIFLFNHMLSTYVCAWDFWIKLKFYFLLEGAVDCNCLLILKG